MGVGAGLAIPAAVGGISTLAQNPPGNNGTTKVDDVPFDDHPDNEPHVGCEFQIDLYGFDEGELFADVIFEAHPPTGPPVLLVEDEVFIGEDDNSGGGSEAGLDASETYDLTAAIVDIEPHPIQGWHVKLTIHADGSQGADVKHKVFWVTGCELPPPTTTTTTTTTTSLPETTTTTSLPETTTTTSLPETTTTTTLPPGDEGCTPGFWKNHPEAWIGFSPSQTLESVFDVPDELGLDDETLEAALTFGGDTDTEGAARILLRAAVAALLNAAHPDVDYPLTTDEVIALVNDALASNDRATMIDVAEQLDILNNLGCSM